MDNTNFLFEFLHLLAGIGIFLTGCDLMSSSLEAVCSDRLRELLAKVSNNKIVGVLIGTAATIAISSSSAMTVMTIGFVNANILSLKQAATIIFGGEIGTTLTGQLVALGMMGDSEVDLNFLFSSLAGFGVFITMFAKKDKLKLLGSVLTGIGLLFAGLDVMSGAMVGFSASPALKEAIASVNSSLLLILFGTILTALIQSSSAMTSISISMVAVGLINISQGIYLTLGANVGTCLTGLLAGLKSEGVNARRTSMIQLIFNIGGVVVVSILDLLMQALTRGSLSIGLIFERLFPGLPHTQLAMFHTIFNIASVIAVLPFTNALVQLTKKLVPDEPEKKKKEHFFYVDENMIETPSVAVEQVKKEIVNMAAIAMENFNYSIAMIRNKDFSKEDQFTENEEELNFLNHSLVEIIVKLTRKSNLSKKDHFYLTSTYHTISDIERIGDYSENIMEYAKNMAEANENFSQSALEEIDDLSDLINKLFRCTIDAYQTGNKKQKQEARKLEDEIDELTRLMAKNHIRRLNEGKCSAIVGAQYLKLSNDAERIGDHLININDYAISR